MTDAAHQGRNSRRVGEIKSATASVHVRGRGRTTRTTLAAAHYRHA